MRVCTTLSGKVETAVPLLVPTTTIAATGVVIPPLLELNSCVTVIAAAGVVIHPLRELDPCATTIAAVGTHIRQGREEERR